MKSIQFAEPLGFQKIAKVFNAEGQARAGQARVGQGRGEKVGQSRISRMFFCLRLATL